MAGTGFPISEELKVKGVTLICPALRDPDRAQLSAKKVHNTKLEYMLKGLSEESNSL